MNSKASPIETDLGNLNFEEFSQALMTAYEKSIPIIQKYMDHHAPHNLNKKPVDPYNLKETFYEYWNFLLKNPHTIIRSQLDFWTKWTELCEESTKQFFGGEAKTLYHAQQTDRRWKDESWQENALFNFIKQSYLMTSEWIHESIEGADHLSKEEKKKLDFHTKQFLDAVAPSNFAITNPQVIKETVESGGENLVKGLKNLIADIERGQGELKISMTDYTAFEVGKNLASTEGGVVYQNDMMQLIQYKASTAECFKTPLLITPPWINKYYILDMKKENSFIKWLVDQGHTVFIISWVNPNSKHANIDFEDYMKHGILEALDVVENITGEKQTNLIGYCIGGTLLASTLSYLTKKKQDKRVKSATFLTTLLDFKESGDLKILIDDVQIKTIDEQMAQKGYLDANSLQQTFAMLRSNDLIWSFVINNYLMGKDVFPFDLLYWNSDSTNLPRAMHKFYLENMYHRNKLTQKNGITLDGTAIDLSEIKTPSYFLSTREDHIAPWEATYQGINLLKNSKSRFTLASSGHIAGVVNPPAAKKYGHWTSTKTPETPEEWLKSAKEHQGSWWPEWQKWIAPFCKEKIKSRKIGSKNYKAIEDAPGSYVRTKAS